MKLPFSKRSVAVGLKVAAGKVSKTVVLVLVGAILAFPAVFVNNVMGYIPVFAYILLVGMSYAYARVLAGNIKLDQGAVDRECIRTEQLDFSFTMGNASILPAVRVDALFYLSSLYGGEGETDTHYVTLRPHGNKTFKVGIRFDHIGSFSVGIREYTVSDPFGLFRFTTQAARLARVDVTPRLVDVGALPVSLEASAEAKKSFTSVINDGMDYSGVREYRWGDPIKAVHWKLSARMPSGEYYTRLYETNANPNLAIVADFDVPEYPAQDLMGVYDTVVECAFSLERYADRMGFDAELLFEDKAKRQRRYASPLVGHHAEILERMPHMFAPDGANGVVGLVESVLVSSFAQVNLIVCTSVVSDELLEALIAAKGGKRVPLLLAVVPERIDERARKDMARRLTRLDSAGVGYALVDDARALEAI